MTPAAGVALAVAAVAAVLDWVAVGVGARRLEYIAKPLALAALVVVAVSVESNPRQPWFVAAAVFSLGGDVFLMLPRDRFVPGLVSFLLAHLCYIGGLAQAPLRGAPAVVGACLVAVAVAVVGPRVLRAVRADHRPLFAPVLVYLVVIAAMVVTAFAAGPALAIAGAVLFFASDSILAVQRFVRAAPWAPVAVMVTYHLAQGALILSMVPA